MDKKQLIKKIRKLLTLEKCGYLGSEGHHPGCSCLLERNLTYNKAIRDVLKLIKSEV